MGGVKEGMVVCVWAGVSAHVCVNIRKTQVRIE